MKSHVSGIAAATCAVLTATTLITAGPAQADPAAAMLSYGRLNEVVARYDPAAPPFWNSDPVRRTPEAPDTGLPAPCGQVLPLYFGGGEPRFRSYAGVSTAGAGNVFVNQLVAQYATPAQAAAKFGQLAGAIPACATGLAGDPTATLTVQVGEVTADAARFDQRPAGKNTRVSNGHDVTVEYRLVGDSIVGVSSSYSAALVSDVADELRTRLPG